VRRLVASSAPGYAGFETFGKERGMYPAGRATDLWQGVVVGFHGSHEAARAVRWAAEQATVRRCPLHLVRVVETPAPAVAAGWVPMVVGPDEGLRRRMEYELLDEVDECRCRNPGLEVRGAMHDGPPCTRLAEHADLVGANVLVVGGSDRGILSRLVFGSTGAGLLRTTRRTVVVVRGLTPVQEAGVVTGSAPVVAAVDDPATSARVLEFASDMADRWDAPLTVVHAGRYREVLEHSADARLVVVAGRGPGVLRGSSSHMVLRHAGCSVAVASAAGRDPNIA